MGHGCRGRDPKDPEAQVGDVDKKEMTWTNQSILDRCRSFPVGLGEPVSANRVGLLTSVRRCNAIRYTLMPTLIAAGRRASQDGTPVVQRLDLVWPEHAEDGASRDDQYLFADGTMSVVHVGACLVQTVTAMPPVPFLRPCTGACRPCARAYLFWRRSLPPGGSCYSFHASIFKKIALNNASQSISGWWHQSSRSTARIRWPRARPTGLATPHGWSGSPRARGRMAGPARSLRAPRTWRSKTARLIRSPSGVRTSTRALVVPTHPP